MNSPGPTAWLNGRFVPPADFAISPLDAGFVLGTTVSEQLRTVGGRLFRIGHHLQRLTDSLEIVGVRPEHSILDMTAAVEEIARRNHALLDAGDDLGAAIFITPGPYAAFVQGGGPPMVGMHAFPLPFHQWADAYETGQSLRVTAVRQVPADCWPAGLKCRSRMHYYLADKQARAAEPGSRALLLDHQGTVVEASTANVLIYREGEGLLSPPREKILPGISVGFVVELAEELDIPLHCRDLSVTDVATAEEVMLTSTSPCLLPVSRLDGRPIGDGRPGPVFRRLIAGWSDRIGLDIVAQARRFADRM